MTMFVKEWFPVLPRKGVRSIGVVSVVFAEPLDDVTFSGQNTLVGEPFLSGGGKP